MNKFSQHLKVNKKAYLTILALTIILLFTLNIFQNYIYEHIIKGLFDNLVFNSIIVKVTFFAIITSISIFYFKKRYHSQNYQIIYISLFILYLFYRTNIIRHPDWDFTEYLLGISYIEVFYIITFTCFLFFFLRRKEEAFAENNTFDKSRHSSIENPNEDKLAFYFDVNRLLKDIFAREDLYKKEALTIGLRSEWGTGKTSYLNLIEYAIISDKTSDSFDKATVIRFNPWFSKSPEQIMIDFLNTLNETIGENNKGISKDIDHYIQVLSKSDIGLLSKILNIIFNKNQPITIESQFQILSNHIAKRDKPLLIFIDDIDRLEYTEIVSVLQLIRNTANFRNTIFIVPYDEVYIHDTLKSNICKPKDYLQKIFTIPYSLPPLNEARYQRFAISLISTGLLIKEDKKSEEFISIQNFIYNIGKRLSIRIINNIVENVNLQKTIFVDEGGKLTIYLYDLLLIEYLNILDKNIYNALAHGNSLVTCHFYYRTILNYSLNFIRNNSDLSPTENEKLKDETFLKKILPLASNTNEVEHILNILKLLFEADNKTGLNNGLNMEDKHPFRMRNAIIFENYFCKSISADTITQTTFDKIVNGRGIESEIIELKERNCDMFMKLFNSMKFDTERDGFELFHKTLCLYPERYEELVYMVGILGINTVDVIDVKNSWFCFYIKIFRDFLENIESDSVKVLNKKFTLIQYLKDTRLFNSAIAVIFMDISNGKPLSSDYSTFDRLYISYLTKHIELINSFEDFNKDFFSTYKDVSNTTIFHISENMKSDHPKSEAKSIIKKYISDNLESFVKQISSRVELADKYSFDLFFEDKPKEWFDNYISFLQNQSDIIKEEDWFKDHLKTIEYTI